MKHGSCVSGGRRGRRSCRCCRTNWTEGKWEPSTVGQTTRTSSSPNLIYCAGSPGCGWSSRKGRKDWSSRTDGVSRDQRIQWRRRGAGDDDQVLLRRSTSSPEETGDPIFIFSFHRVHKVNQDRLVLQAPRDLPTPGQRTSLLCLTITTETARFQKPWSSSMTAWLQIHLQRSTETKLFPTGTRPSCVGTPGSTPPSRPSGDNCKTSAVLTAARQTPPKPARTSSSATLRRRAVRDLLVSSLSDQYHT